MEKITWSGKKLDNLTHHKHMLLTSRYYVRFVLLILMFLMAGYLNAQPSLLNRKVSLSVINQPISAVLQQISKQADIRFSYNPELLSPTQRVTFNVTGKPVLEVLKMIFNDPSTQFKEIGNQLVIFENADWEKNSLTLAEKPLVNDKVSPKPANKLEPLLKNPDTVYLSKTDTILIIKTDTLTIFKTETIIQHDTTFKTDTIYLYKTQKPGKGISPNFDRNSMKNRKFRENNGWYAGLNYEHLFGNTTLTSTESNSSELLIKMQQSVSGSYLNYSVEAMFGYDYHRFGLRSGISYTRLGESFEYSFTRQVGGYYKTDTVESYYTVNSADTSWYYITDSSYVNIDYKNFSYKNPNAYRYIEVPLLFKFRFIAGENLDVYAMAGLITSLGIGRKALYIRNEEEFPVDWIASDMMKPIFFSWKAGLGAAYSFGGSIGVMAEFSYRNQFTSLLMDYPVQKKFSLFNVKTGIFVRL